jgi:hypothetical protein
MTTYCVVGSAWVPTVTARRSRAYDARRAPRTGTIHQRGRSTLQWRRPDDDVEVLLVPPDRNRALIVAEAELGKLQSADMLAWRIFSVATVSPIMLSIHHRTPLQACCSRNTAPAP